MARARAPRVMATRPRPPGPRVAAMTAPVPTVDLRPWYESDDEGRREVARELDDACRAIGFLQITGHGIADEAIEEMRAATDAFFALPVEEKLEVVPAHAGINRGDAPMGT